MELDRQSQWSCNYRGFLLLELLFSLMMVGIIASSCALWYCRLSDNSAHLRNRLQALVVAASVVEQLHSGTLSVSRLHAGYTEGKYTVSYSPCSFHELVPVGLVHFMPLCVKVSWQGGGKEWCVSLVTALR